MKTTELRVGSRYVVRGQLVLVRRIYGRGRNRKVGYVHVGDTGTLADERREMKICWFADDCIPHADGIPQEVTP